MDTKTDNETFMVMLNSDYPGTLAKLESGALHQLAAKGCQILAEDASDDHALDLNPDTVVINVSATLEQIGAFKRAAPYAQITWIREEE